MEDYMITAAMFDIDGTLADCAHRRHHLDQSPKDWKAFYAGMKDDGPKRMPLGLVQAMRQFGLMPVFVTGRPERFREVTKEWLRSMHCPSSPLFMRPDDDFRADHELKREIYLRDIQPHYDVKIVLDDRDSVVRMWRELGLECWQVAAGDF
jgi:hypothetical protein